MEIDISSIADGNPSVQIEFSLVTDAGLTFGGWNIDDVEIVTIDPSCPGPNNYCTCYISAGADSIEVAACGLSPSTRPGESCQLEY